MTKYLLGLGLFLGATFSVDAHAGKLTCDGTVIANNPDAPEESKTMAVAAQFILTMGSEITWSLNNSYDPSITGVATGDPNSTKPFTLTSTTGDFKGSLTLVPNLHTQDISKYVFMELKEGPLSLDGAFTCKQD